MRTVETMPALRPVRVSAPAVTPISLAELKQHRRREDSDDDTFFAALIDVVVSHFDGWSGILGRCMINQSWRFGAHIWGGRGMLIPLADISAVTVTYRDAADATQTLDAGAYRRIETVRGSLIEWTSEFTAPALGDGSAAISCVVTAGFGALPGDVPAAIRHALLLLAGHLDENREATAPTKFEELPFAVQSLIAPHCRNRLA